MIRRILLLGLLAVGTASPAEAHDGPPYPILVDEPIAGALLSIWADPDVGVGTFYLYIEDREEGFEIPPIELLVMPLDREGEECGYEAELPDEEGAAYDRIILADFSHQGPWRARFRLGEQEEIALDVDVTPPGMGKIDLAWFLAPFVAIGLFWIKVIVGKRNAAVEVQTRGVPS